MKYEQSDRYQKFVNEINDQIILESPKITDHRFLKETGLFKYVTSNGVIDFYAHTNKICFGKNIWQTDGLNKLLEYVKAKKKPGIIDDLEKLKIDLDNISFAGVNGLSVINKKDALNLIEKIIIKHQKQTV